jgi:hypothetical protein
MADELVREHVLAVLRDRAAWRDGIREQLDRLEAEGYRLVTGGPLDENRWMIEDFRTHSVLACGNDGEEGCDRAVAKLNDEQPVYHAEQVPNDIEVPNTAAESRLSRRLPKLAALITDSWAIGREDPIAIVEWLGEDIATW